MLLLCAAIWGLAFAVQSQISGDLGSYTIVFLKNSGFVLLIPVSLLYKQKFTKEVYIDGFILGVIMFFACFFQQKGIEVSSAGKSSFITALYIVLVPFVSFLLGRKLNRYALIGVGIAVIGMYFLCIKGEFAFVIGDLYLFLGAFFLALQISFIDKFVTKCDAIPLACIQQATIAIIAMIMMISKETININSIKTSLPQILYLTIFAGVVAEALQMTYQKIVEPTLASLLMSFESVFGAIFGFIVLHEILSKRELFGCLLIFIAVLIAQKKKQ